jgi:signal transduction histidine kinase
LSFFGMNSRRALIVVGACLLLAATLAGFHAYRVSPTRGLPDKEAFTQKHADDWDAFGGTWEVTGGNVRNSSDERGAKLMTGSRYWNNYSIDADVMLLGTEGDAGLILRSSNEEQGVDAYYGYYAGLRSYDNSLVLGRAEYGWTEAVTPLNPAEGRITALRWYHLKLLAYNCQIAAVVTIPGTAVATTSTVADNDCIRAGRAGLRSYASGGVWRNVVIRPAAKQDLSALIAARDAGNTVAQPQPSSSAAENQQFNVPAPRADPFTFHASSNTQSISSLRLTSFAKPAVATVRGSVIFTAPLVVQDATGGVAVPHPASAPPLKLGDQVEVSGTVRLNAFIPSLEHANVRVLWEGTPLPPVTVSASQAATGAFDATFVEVDGRLRSKRYGPDNTLIFTFDAGPQSFSAIMGRGRGDYLFSKLKPKSLLRMRGVVMIDPAYTGNLTPFVLLLRSADDIDVLAGPPWWSAQYMVPAGFALLVLALATNFLYGRVERWRLRAVLEERERMAHEIHDTLAQSFAGIGFQLEAIRSGIPHDMRSTHQQLDLASDLVHHSHIEARRSIATLRPDALASEDLLANLSSCVHRMAEGGAVQVRTTCNGDARNVPASISCTLYRIGQEAIANAIQHAHPSTIALSLDYEKDVVRLSVMDDGEGFTPGGEMHGFGIPGMRKRAARISARFEMMSESHRGTCIQVTAPIPPPLTWTTWPKIFIKSLKEHRPHAKPAKAAH